MISKLLNTCSNLNYKWLFSLLFKDIYVTHNITINNKKNWIEITHLSCHKPKSSIHHLFMLIKN